MRFERHQLIDSLEMQLAKCINIINCEDFDQMNFLPSTVFHGLRLLSLRVGVFLRPVHQWNACSYGERMSDEVLVRLLFLKCNA